MARPWSRGERATRWCGRNPAVAGLISAVALLSILTFVMAVSIALESRRAQLQLALKNNGYAARDAARIALLQIRDLSDAVEVAARDTALSDLLARKDDAGLQAYLKEICPPEPIPFASCTVLDSGGIQMERVPKGSGTKGEDFSYRDYYIGARAHNGLPGRRSVHTSKIYLSRGDDLYKFSMSAPIVGGDGKSLGVITTSVTTDATMGEVKIEDPSRIVALIAPRDVESSDVDSRRQPRKVVIVFHEGYSRGFEPVELPDDWESMIAPLMQPDHASELDISSRVLSVDNYPDPVGSVLPKYHDRWITGFAPVGNTGFVVSVQQRYDEALDSSLFRNLLVGSSVVVFLAVLIVVLVLRRWSHSDAPGLDHR